MENNNQLYQAPVEPCECSKSNVLIIGMRNLSLLVSGLIILFFFVFMTGYFLGKRSAYEDVAGVLVQDSLSDQVYAAMCSVYGNEDEKESAEEQQLESDEVADAAEPDAQAVKVADGESAVADAPALQTAIDVPENVSAVDTVHYYAQLAGFGSQESAERFARKLRAKNIKVTVARRRSKTARGKLISWYQVVTQSYTDREALDTLVSRLQKEERLHDIRVINC